MGRCDAKKKSERERGEERPRRNLTVLYCGRQVALVLQDYGERSDRVSLYI